MEVLTLDRLQKIAVDMVTQNPKEIDCEDLKDSAGAIEDSIGQSDTEQRTVEYEVLTQGTHCRRQQRTH